MLLAGLKSNGHSEGRRGESVQLGKTQSLIFYMIIFHYSAIFKAKKSFFPSCSKPLFTTMSTFPEILHFWLGIVMVLLISEMSYSERLEKEVLHLCLNDINTKKKPRVRILISKNSLHFPFRLTGAPV